MQSTPRTSGALLARQEQSGSATDVISNLARRCANAISLLALRIRVIGARSNSPSRDELSEDREVVGSFESIARRPAAVLVLVLLLGFGTRLLLMRNAPIFVDEVFEARDILSQSVVDNFRHFRLDALLLHALLTRPMTLLGWEPYLLRWTSLCVGLLSLPLGYQLGRRLFGNAVGTLAMALLAVLPTAVGTSITVRGYSLMITLSLASSLALIKAVDGRQLRHWLLFGIGVALIIHNHAFGALLMAPALAYIAWRLVPAWPRLPAQERTRLLRGLLLSLLVVGAAALGLVALLRQSDQQAVHELLLSDNYASDLIPFQLSNPLATLASYLEPLRRASFPDGPGWCVYLCAFLALIGIAAGSVEPKTRHGVVFLSLLAFLPLPLTTAAQGVLGSHAFTRYLDFALPAYPLLAALGVWWLATFIGRRVAPAGAITGLLLTTLIVVMASEKNAETFVVGEDQQMVQTAHYLSEHAHPDDVILCVARDDPQAESKRLGDVRQVKAETCLLTLYTYPDLADRAFAWQEMDFVTWQSMLTPDHRCVSRCQHHPHPWMEVTCDDGKPLGPRVWLVFWQPLAGQAPLGSDLHPVQAGFGSTRLVLLADDDQVADSFRQAGDLILADDRVSDLRTVRNVLAMAHLDAALADAEGARALLMSHEQQLGALDESDRRSLIKRAEALISYLPYLGGAAQPEAPVRVSWGNQIELRGYTARGGAITSGSLDITVTLFWQAERTLHEEYTFFLHWLDSEGNVLRQMDYRPYDGRLPSTLWSPGTVLRETRTLTVPAPVPGNAYRLVLGMYGTRAGTRLTREDVQSDDGTLELLRWTAQ